jgi:hypothetical protein
MDDWKTVNIKPGKGGVIRDIDLLRKRYDDHRAALEQLAADAPTEHLARRYRDVVADIDASVAKLDALDGEPAAAPPAAGPAAAAARSWSDAPVYAHEPVSSEARRRGGGGRALLILLAGAFMIGIIALLFWSWLRRDDPEAPIVRPETAVTETLPAPAAEAEPDLAVVPERHDYGTIRRGARAARQFEIRNNTDEPMAIDVKRSACRCLWFEYADTIPARGTTTLTVTVDASKVTGAQLEEMVEVVTTADPGASATFVVAAAVGTGVQ